VALVVACELEARWAQLVQQWVPQLASSRR
jgi:hypothetical protein